MKNFLDSVKKQFNLFARKIKRTSLARWGVIIAVVTVVITLAQWLYPDPFKSVFNPTPQPPSLAESLGITQPIPEYRPGTIRILIATFDGPDEDARKISSDIKATLEKNLASEFNSTIEVIGTNRVITEMEGSNIAIQIGELYNASIVIWGWYGIADNLIPLGAHFEIINSTSSLGAIFCPASTSQRKIIKREALENLTLQTNLSSEYTYVTLFTLGLARFGSGDWNAAIEKFDEAIKYIPEGELSAETSKNKLLVDKDLLYYFRGVSLRSVDRFEDALSDFKEIESNWAYDPYYHLELGLVYQGINNTAEAIDQFSMVYENAETSELKTIALLYRAIANYQLGNYQDVNKDMNLAVVSDEYYAVIPILFGEIPHEFSFNVRELESQNLDNALTYFLRAIKNENQDGSLEEYNKSIEIVPGFLLAHFKRGDLLRQKLLSEKSDPALASIVLDDFNLVAKSKDFQVSCTYLNLGFANKILDQDQLAHEAFLKTISLATDEIDVHPTNVYAYNERGAAYYQLGNNFFALLDIIRLRFMNSEETSSMELDKGFRNVIKDFAKQIIPVIPFLLIGLQALKSLTLLNKTQKTTPKK